MMNVKQGALPLWGSEPSTLGFRASDIIKECKGPADSIPFLIESSVNECCILRDRTLPGTMWREVRATKNLSLVFACTALFLVRLQEGRTTPLKMSLHEEYSRHVIPAITWLENEIATFSNKTRKQNIEQALSSLTSMIRASFT